MTAFSDTIPARFPAPLMDLIEYLSRGVIDQQINLAITFAGLVDVERMARAVRLTLDAEPILGCRFVEHPQRPYWQRCDDLDHLPLCQMVETSDPTNALREFIGAPLDACAGPQVQARIFRADHDTLVIKVGHVATDAAGIVEYVGLLSTIYQNLATDSAYRPLPNLHGSRGLDQVFKHVSPLALMRAFRRYSSPAPAWGFPSTSQDRSGRAFAIRRIGPERLASIKAYGRQRQATVNDVLLAAFYRALFEVLDPPVDVPLPAQLPINLRRYIPSGRAEAICNLTGALYTAICRKPEAAFDDTLTATHTAMETAKADQLGALFSGALFLKSFFLLGFARVQPEMEQQMALHPFLSNVGGIDPQQVGFADAEVIDAYGVAPVLYPPGFLVGASTFRGTLTLSASFCDTATEPRLVERVLDLFERELPH